MQDKNAFKVGLFVIATTIIVSSAIGYLIHKKGVFEKVYTFTLAAKTGDGLTKGMPVLFSGFTIGKVDNVELNDQGIVIIKIKIPKRHSKWIRFDSTFSFDKPLIGAPIISVKTENMSSRPLSEKDVLEIRTVNDINEVIKRIHPILDTITRVAGNIETVSANVAKLTGTFSSKSSILEMAVNDPDSVKSFHESMKSMKVITSRLEDTLKKVDAMADKTDTKIYGSEGALSLANNILKDLIAKLQNLDTTVSNINTISNSTAESTKDLKQLRGEIDITIYSIKELAAKIDDMLPLKKRSDIKLP